MTFGITNIIAIIKLCTSNKKYEKNQVQKIGFLRKYLIECHRSHLLEFFVALICYNFVFPIDQASKLSIGWISQVFAFNLTCELLFFGFWHWILYSKTGLAQKSREMLDRKYNPENQYVNTEVNQLNREVMYTTIGWLISSGYQCLIMHLFQNGTLPYYNDFWKYPVYSVVQLMLVTYWREFHFYWVHRFMHPWGWKLPIFGDFGQFLYNKVHSLHHKSYNTGPWSGLSMHPVEHIIYYSCTLLCLVFQLHPMHFLYAKFHADIAPIGGHDGFQDPAGNSGYHYLHHSKFECNYGTDLVNFDELFGTFLDWDDYKKILQKNQNKTMNIQEILRLKNKMGKE